MNLQELPFFSMVTKRMAWLTMRQQVLAQNIANADTPNYKPMDLTQQSFRKMLAPRRPGMELRRTTGNHIEQMPRSIAFRSEKARTTYETAPSGNAVVLEEQLMKVAETQGLYRLATNLYQKHVGMIKTALSRGR
jgi:flagellar basal-body rod protein FlgB